MDDKENNLLKEAFEERKARRTVSGELSIRAFAIQLKTSPTTLSETLNERRELSVPLARKILCDERTSPHLRMKLESFIAKKEKDHSIKKRAVELSVDEYEKISDWLHFAILNLMDCENFDSATNEFSERIGIAEDQIKHALDNLLNLGLVYVDSDLMWQKNPYTLRTDSTRSSLASQKTYAQLLEKALQSMKEDDFSERDLSGTMMAIDSDLLPLAKQEIRKFRNYLTNKLESRGNQKDVYQLCIQFFPISKRQ